MNLHPRSHQTRPCFSCASGCPCWGSRQQRHHSMLPISSPFQSKLHPKSKTKPPSAMINQHVCASKIKSHRLSTTITALVEWCCSTAAISRHRPNKTAGPRENETQTPNKTTGRQSEGDRNENKRAGRRKNANCEAVMKVTKKLLYLAFESKTVVLLSSYHSLSVNAVSPISHKRVCTRVLSRDCDQCDSESVRQFFSSLFLFSLSYLVSPVPISPCNRCLYSLCALKRSQTACRRKQVWNEKGQITREWWSWGEKEWKGERLGQITREGEREEMAENNIIGRERWQREKGGSGEGARETANQANDLNL